MMNFLKKIIVVIWKFIVIIVWLVLRIGWYFFCWWCRDVNVVINEIIVKFMLIYLFVDRSLYVFMYIICLLYVSVFLYNVDRYFSLEESKYECGMEI